MSVSQDVKTPVPVPTRRERYRVSRQLARIDALVRFRGDHGRWPRDTASESEERGLARFIRHMRTADLDHEVATYLSEQLGELPARRFRGSGLPVEAEQAAFVALHGREPRASGEMVTERTLAARIRRRAKASAPNVLDWDPQTPRGRERRPDVDRFRARVEALLHLKRELGAWPSRSATDPSHRSLADFRYSLRAPLLPAFEAVLYELDTDLGRWARSPLNARDRNLCEDIPRIAAHLATHGKRPRHTDPDPGVRRLARSLARLRNEGVPRCARYLVDLHLASMTLRSETLVKRERRRAEDRHRGVDETAYVDVDSGGSH